MTADPPPEVAPYGDPVTSLAELDQLDDADLVEGYRDGRAGEPEPKGNRSRSYWHGWRNGAVDGGHREKDDEQAILAHLYLRRAAIALALPTQEQAS